MHPTNIKTSKTTYKKLLNNLLDIKGRQQSIFTRVNGISSFDITTKFGKEISKKIINQKDFSFFLSEIDYEELLRKVKNANNAKDIIDAYEFYKERLFATKKLLLEKEETFLETKEELIEKIKEKIQKTSSRWKQFRRKIIDINIQENIWPLHIATCFISMNTNRRPIYAPLLLKEINIEVNGPKIKIKSINSWKLNKKIIFLLNECDFQFNESMNLDNLTFNECLEKIKNELNIKIDLNIFENKFLNQNINMIENKIIEIKSGVVMGIYRPSGGNLRKTMMKIIDNEEIDDIIDIEPDKSIYRNKITNFLEKESEKLLRIQPSNYSQDKALISSLIQDTIIWGPPGTGKSQVIANIIANILYKKNKNAVVMSQKKAALDVLKKRLGKISQFCLFILNDNKMKKENFYKPLQDFVIMVEQNYNYPVEKKTSLIISSDEIKFLKIIDEYKKNNKYLPSINLISILKENIDLIGLLFQLDNSLIYPKKSLEIKEFIKIFAKLNNINKKKFLFFKWYPSILKMNAKISSILLQNNIDVNQCNKFALNTNKELIINLINFSKKFIRSKKNILNEKYLVDKLAKRILKKINLWKTYNDENYKNYKKFANAVRAGRALPFKFINKHIEIIRNLFPIIITTPETSFINWKKESFDYAILDESSQMFLEIGLPILYLAKIKVLAGDTKQMQPSRWFATRDDSEDDEEDIPENADSLLNYALDKGVYQIMLDQNYRSSFASLMAFSSKKFYESKLEIIDSKNKITNSKNAIEIINVDGEWEKGTNIIEAKKVITIAEERINQYKSIIILTFNSNQRQLIEKMILENNQILHSKLEDGTLAIRNIENIQGDEADLVIISVVYDKTTNISSTYVARDGGKNALNVAISRAKNKMIVVKSINFQNIKFGNSKDYKIFKEWLEFLDMKYKEKEKNYINKSQIKESYGETESNFEREVVDEICSKIKSLRKLKLIKQYLVGSKKIDIAIVDENNEFILGIEVDGYKYHKGYEKYLKDYSRQDFLEQKGYKIFRIKEIDWKLKKEFILKQIESLIKKLDLKNIIDETIEKEV